VPGELCVGGASLARGYLNREALTAERFVPNRIDPRLGDRLYRTGDLVRWREDGELVFLGRTDDQVKLRGFRIELGEIEAALIAEPAVAEAVAMVRSASGGGGERLVAYVVPHTDRVDPLAPGAFSAELRSALKRRLPEYMVPSACVVLQSLPLLPSGKLDRSALSAPEAYTGADHIEPATPTEQAVAVSWAQLLELDVASVGANANFFDLGGHSILAIRLAAELGASFGVDLSVRDLFHYPSLAELARHIDETVGRDASDWNPRVVLDATSGVPVLYCFPAAGLTAFSYRPLARALQGRLALQVFDPCGVDGRVPPCRSMEETVALNLRALLAHQPQGPYLLAGHSYGGAIAFEVARALEMRGHEVRLALIDSIVYLRDVQRAEHSVVGYLKRLLGADTEDACMLEKLDEEEALRAFFAQRMQRQGLTADVQDDTLGGVVNVFRAQLAIYGDYRPMGRYGGTMTSILARDGEIARLEKGELADHYAAYAAGEVELHVAGGGHLSLLSSEQASGLADLLVHLCASADTEPALPS
jgi:thioesterase domain-containing protein/acyl carrier protein